MSSRKSSKSSVSNGSDVKSQTVSSNNGASTSTKHKNTKTSTPLLQPKVPIINVILIHSNSFL